MLASTVKVPTPLESSLVSAILKHHDGPLNVDWEGVAQTMGYKNGQVASDRFRQVKKKLGWGTNSTANKGSTPSRSKVGKTRTAPAKPRAPAARKPAAKKVGTDTKPRGAKAKAKFVQKESEGDVEVEAEEDKPRDLMAASDDEETDETSFEKVNRKEYADDYESEGTVSDLQRQIGEEDLQKQMPDQAEEEEEEEYDAYDPDAVFDDAIEEYVDANQGAEEHSLYAGKTHPALK